jgi:antitoxin ParD1/3/4
MSIALRPDTERQIEDQMKSGGYSSPDDVVHAALKALDDDRRSRTTDIEDLRRQIAVGLEQLDRGEGVDGEQAFDELLGELDVKSPKGSA